MQDMIFIIAEIGVNWDGDFDLAKEMMTKAKEAGCDAVKFQAFNEEIVKEHPERSRLMKSAISNGNIETIDRIARSIEIEWFCTPMYTKAVDILDPYVHRFKIREKDGQSLLKNENSDLIERVLKTNKEVIVSSASSPKNSDYYKNSDIKWLYCVPKYPCALNDLNFRDIKDFDGYSNHCPSIVAPLAAAILGTKILEIHATSNKSKNFFDNNVSFDYAELMTLIKLIRDSEKIVS
jgi:sialic acid synthase SpsE